MELRRILIVSVSPIQNVKPYRLLESAKNVKATVLYLKRPKVQLELDKESITKAAFDHDLTSGYDNQFLKVFNLRNSGFFSLISFEVVKWVRQYDIVVIHGHNYFTFWLAMVVAKLLRKKLVQTTDAIYMEATSASKGWKMKLKPFFLRTLYNRFVDAVFVMSTASKLFLTSVGIIPSRIAIIPYAVDEDLIEEVSASTDVHKMRSEMRIPLEAMVFVFCAKFISRKRPNDVLEAFAKLENENCFLIMIGDGPLKEELVSLGMQLKINKRVIFPGLVPYSRLPMYYTASDVLVFSSDHEPYGLPVNEAMLCGKPAIVSDRIGARLDLVKENETGWIYPVGDIQQLAKLMKAAAQLKEKDKLFPLGASAKKRMETWSSVTNVSSQLDFFKSRGWVV